MLIMMMDVFVSSFVVLNFSMSNSFIMCDGIICMIMIVVVGGGGGVGGGGLGFGGVVSGVVVSLCLSM